MQLPSNEDLSIIKLSIIKDLEKTLKIGYEHQYKNILSKIVSKKNRFVKKRLPSDMSENIARYDARIYDLTNYLINLFDVFGENAVLNAKKTFEDNGSKWGKKLQKKYLLNVDITDITNLIRDVYISVPDTDYIEISEDSLVWHFCKFYRSCVSEDFDKFHPRFYDVKATWLHSFIKSSTSQYTSIFEKKNEDEKEILTSIELKQDII